MVKPPPMPNKLLWRNFSGEIASSEFSAARFFPACCYAQAICDISDIN
jgi:hypothetical protein